MVDVSDRPAKLGVGLRRVAHRHGPVGTVLAHEHVADFASQIRTAFSKIASKTAFKSPGDELITLRTSKAAESCSNASSRSRLNSAIFLALVLEESRRPLTFGALDRFVFVVARRRFFMALLSAAHVPIAAMPPPRRREYQETAPLHDRPRLRSGHGTGSDQCSGRGSDWLYGTAIWGGGGGGEKKKFFYRGYLSIPPKPHRAVRQSAAARLRPNRR